MAGPRDFNPQLGFVAKRNPLTYQGVNHVPGQEFIPARFGMDERGVRRLWEAGHIMSRRTWEAAGHTVIPAPAASDEPDKPRRGRPPRQAPNQDRGQPAPSTGSG